MMNSSDNVDNGQQQHDQDNSKPPYTIPGILHYIQHEWAKFEMERSQWDVERAELNAKIAFLDGERKGQENLKRDLVRRIKMLEYALRQERARLHKMKYGSDLVLELRHKEQLNSNDELNKISASAGAGIEPSSLTTGATTTQQQPSSTPNTNGITINNNNNSLRHGRQLLRQYLQEVGYSETILDVRSQRVRALLSNNQQQNNNIQPSGGHHNNHDNNDVELVNGIKNSINKKKDQQGPQGGTFITETNGDVENDENNSDITTEVTVEIVTSSSDVNEQSTTTEQQQKQQDEIDLVDELLGDFDSTIDKASAGTDEVTSSTSVDNPDDNRDQEQVDVLSEFDFLSCTDDNTNNTSSTFQDENSVQDWPVDQNKIELMKEQFQKEKRSNKKKGSKRPVKKDLQNMLETLKGTDTSNALSQQQGSQSGTSARINDDMPTNNNEEDSLPFTVGGPRINDDNIDNALGLGDLAGLTVANEADILCLNVNQSSKEPFRRMWNPKYTLRSHFDGVRSVRFLPNVNGCITGSEDHTLKLWNLNKPTTSGGGGKRSSSSLDLDSIYTFRGHVGAVLCCEIGGPEGDICYSGGVDSTIRCWNIPSITSDPYENYDPSVSESVLIGHTDAVWSLSYANQQLLSASSDKTVRLWNPLSKDPLRQTYAPNTSAAPTCVEFVKCDCNHAVVSYTDGKIIVQDLETGKIPVVLQESGDSTDRVNCVVTHPTIPLTISAHDDRHIKFFDNTSGKKIHEMVAHLDVVSSLAVDSNGLYLLSGSHDASIRLWNLDTKTCIQELTSHRRKFDESIYSVTFHQYTTSQQPQIASAGADAIVKIFE